MIQRLASVPFSALVLAGETGTGKGLVARLLHQQGVRSGAPLIEVNCAALPRDLLESELFGHEAGAFTGAKSRHHGYLEQADGGTLFLDELSELPLDLQGKLLKVIEDRSLCRLGGEHRLQLDLQLLVATNQPLEDCVRAGRFRADLFHRLSVFRLEIPPLRERLEDLSVLVPALITEFNQRAGGQVRDVPVAVYQAMRAYHWPGNVRELRNVIERGVLLAEDEVFPIQWLQLEGVSDPATLGCEDPHSTGRAPPASAESMQPNWRSDSSASSRDCLQIPLDGSMALDEMDRHIIQTALERCGYNVTAAARRLGTTRETLRYRVHKYGLAPPHSGAS